MPVVLAAAAAALIAVFEGERLTVYRDPGGVLTIGIGHTGPDVHEGMAITQELALDLFAEDQRKLIEVVRERPVLEAAALVSFGFNCGTDKLLKVLAGADSVDNPVHFTDHKGNILPGLRTRRNLESMLISISRQMSSLQD